MRRRRVCNRMVSSCLLAASAALVPGVALADEVRGGPDAGVGEASTLATTLPAGSWELAAAGFVTDASSDTYRLLVPVPTLAVGLGGRWQLSILALALPELAYRFGEAGGTEVVVSAGLAGLGRIEEVGWIVGAAAAVAVRQPLGGGAVIGAVSGETPVERGGPDARPFLATWTVAGTAGITWTFGDRFTVTPGIGILGARGRGAEIDAPHLLDDRELHGAVVLGSVVGVAGRKRPLVRLHLTPDFSVDGHGSWARGTRAEKWSHAYAAGVTWTF